MTKRFTVTFASFVLVVAGCTSGTVSPTVAPSAPGTAPAASIAATAEPRPSPSTGPSGSVTLPSQSPSPATIGEAADDGAGVVDVQRVDDRTVDLTIGSPAVGSAAVRLLLPAGFDSQPNRKWPVLYLLHGAGGSHLDWTKNTDVEALTAPEDVIVAMPDAALSWYSDAWNGVGGGRPLWETFHVTELRQLLERNWHASDRRAVAGLSMGGLGAMDYAARHPDLFLAAASYSGVLDPLGAVPRADAEAAFGDPVEQVENWKAHDPVYLAPSLRGKDLYVSYGNGMAGPIDDGTSKIPDKIEQWVAAQNERFVSELERLNIPATVDAYGPGTHAWPYWERALHESLPMLMDALTRGS